MTTKRRNFVCNKCGVKGTKTVPNYLKQFKRWGYLLCGKCGMGVGITNSALTIKKKFASKLKYYDAIDIECPICHNIRKARKRQIGIACKSCAVKRSRITHKLLYDKLANNRRGNIAFANKISTGILKTDKIERSNKSRVAAQKRWDNPEWATIELKRRKSKEYRDAMAAIWLQPGIRRSQTCTTTEFIAKAIAIHGNEYDYSKTIYTHSKKKIIIICKRHGEFSQIAADHISHNNGCPKCASDSSIISGNHLEIYNYIKSIYSGVVNNNARGILPNNYEIDIWIPELKIGIEHHGLYWHSYDKLETRKQRLRHHEKANLSNICNMRLLQIFETEWNTKNQIIKSMFRHIFKLNFKIGARSCFVTNISGDMASMFFDANHLQGGRIGKYNFGLFSDDKLVSAISIANHKKYNHELMRYATLNDHCVVGGFSKLLKYASTTIGLNQLITYADRRYSLAEIYIRNGFKPMFITKPNYYYVYRGKIYNRQRFQKHKLPGLLKNFDVNKSESINMFNHGFRRIWDAGHYKLIKIF